MKKVLGQTFRKFIQDKGIEFKIYTHSENNLTERFNKKEDLKLDVNAIDPINDYEPTLLNSADIDIGEDTLNLKVFELKDNGQEINRENGLNIANQGFYIIRNNREISTGETLNLFNKHNDNNLLGVNYLFLDFQMLLLEQTLANKKLVLIKVLKIK